MSDRFALTGARIFDGDEWHEDAALVVRDGLVEAILPTGAIPSDVRTVETGGGILAPGFVDMQVNGGGGTQFNDSPTPEGIAQIIRAHAQFGTTRLLPTLITDNRQVTAAAITAGEQPRCKRCRVFSACISKARICRSPARARMIRR